MRGTLVGSAAVHAALLATLLIVRAPMRVVLPGPEVVQVALLEAPVAQPPAPAPAPPPRPQPIEPADEQGVKLAPAPKKKKPAPETPPPPRPAPAQRPAAPQKIVLPYAPVGGGVSGQVAVDQPDFEFAYYLQQVRAMISANYATPAGTPSGTHCEIHFRIARDGTIGDLQLTGASGSGVFDQAALRAVVVTAKLPPLPLGYAGGTLGVSYDFEYTGP